MQIPRRIIDDFKNDRKGILPPLKPILRLVPMLFYLAAASAFVLTTLFIVHTGILKANIVVYNAGIADAKAQIANTAAERAKLEMRILKATDVQAWVEGSRPLQPLAVAVSRSIGDNATLGDLKLTRDEQSPATLTLTMKLGSASATSRQQLDLTTASIAKDYRLVQPQQTFSQGEVDYRVTLVNPAQATNDPQEEAAPPVLNTP